jgi:hypothetical protein
LALRQTAQFVLMSELQIYILMSMSNCQDKTKFEFCIVSSMLILSYGITHLGFVKDLTLSFQCKLF